MAWGDSGTPGECFRSPIWQDKELWRSRIESELLEALQTPQIAIDPEEPNGKSLIDLLHNKLARS